MIRARFNDRRLNDDEAWINYWARLDDNLWFEMSVRYAGMIWIHGRMGMSNRTGLNYWVDNWIRFNYNLWFRWRNKIRIYIVWAWLDDK